MRNPRTLDAQHIRLSSCLVYSPGGSCWYCERQPIVLSKPLASFLAAFYRVGPDGRHGSAPPADASGSMGRAVSEAALYTQLSALHRCLVRVLHPCGISCWLMVTPNVSLRLTAEMRQRCRPVSIHAPMTPS